VEKPAPSGGNAAGFSTSVLSGTYVYAVNGVSGNNQFAVLGTFTADGNGNVTSGTRDTVNDAGGQTLSEAISGTYSVNVDGRGQLVLNGANGSNQAIYRFVLSSPSAGKLFQDGSGSTSVVADAIGRLEQQSGAAAASGPYIFRFDGEDTNKFPYGAIGGLSVTGGTISGLIDENDSGVFNANIAATGAISLTGTRGTAQITLPPDQSTSFSGTHHYVVYYVSANRVELLSTDTNFFLHGYADLQTSTVAATADQVFNLSGFDGNSSSVFPVIETGRFTLTSGAAPVNAFMDYNEENAYYAPSFSGGPYTVGSGGRWTLSLSSFSTGPFANQNLVGWQVTPTQALVLVSYGNNTLVSGYGIVATGDMRAQTLGLNDTSLSGNNFAQFFSGSNTSLGNFESTGNYLANSTGSLGGTIDFQTDTQGLTVDSAQTGNFTVDPTYGRGSASVSGIPVVFYTVDASDVYLISSDASSVYQGTLTLQVP
jgi:hypothetical protein